MGAKLSCPLLAPLLEKKLHQFLAFGLEHADRHRCLGVQGIGGKARKATFLIGSSIDNTAYLRPSQSTSTHHTRFQSYVLGAIIQVLATQLVGRRRDGLHFGM